MSGPWAYGRTQANRPASLDPKAGEFAPTGGNACDPVFDATFVSHIIPDISPDAIIVGLCPVPRERAGMDDLGWHVTDFLAWKHLLKNESYPKNQTWLAQCDLKSIVGADSSQYVHGKERRFVLSAADHILVQPDHQKLMTNFVRAVSMKANMAKESGDPLLIVVCGPTTAEQDVFFGETDEAHHLKSGAIRRVIGEDIEVVLITPAIFSAGWQVNPSFIRSPANVHADRTDFLARQFGGVFTEPLMRHFVGPTCPFFDGDGMSMTYAENKLCNPFQQSDEQRKMLAVLKVTIHKALAGRLSVGHGDHSFDFEVEHDDWEKLVGPRKHMPLEGYRKKWESLGVSAQGASGEKFDFLGNAFGGNKKSQLNHIKHLIKDSFESWPCYWKLPFGKNAKATFAKILNGQEVDENHYHEVFNVLEHRATLAVLVDITVRPLDIPGLPEGRCRNWDVTARYDDHAVQYKEIRDWIPGVSVPPEVNPNNLSAIQGYFDFPVSYLAEAVVQHQIHHGGSAEAITRRISDLFQGARSRQIELLGRIPEVEQKCTAWLDAINMPIRRPSESLADLGQLEASTKAAVEGSEIALPDPQPCREVSDILKAMSSGQSIEADLSTMQETQAELDDYFTTNPRARGTMKMILAQDPAETMQILLHNYENVNKQMQASPNDEALPSIKQDLDYFTKKFLLESKKRQERVDAQSTPAQQEPEPREPWVPPHLRYLAGKAAERTKENNPPRVSSSPVQPTPDRSAGSKPSALTHRASEEPEKKKERGPDREIFVAPHRRNQQGNGAMGGGSREARGYGGSDSQW
ncbi:hypothetical protein F4781DRAFT_442474 [Annulohypoxylon bovei var. microspora]|nr:hypothetical protein F4781DRAFT_442474 [Annulohypoxylon bovei var. microspora]